MTTLELTLDRMQQGTLGQAGFAQVGPKLAERADLQQMSVDIWLASSMQLQSLASGNGFSYYHFLQPNQYLSGSKVFSDRERRQALRQPEKWSEAVTSGYPKLQAGGTTLRQAGIDFSDLTGIFQGVTETLYMDSCCHVNELGSELLARAIVARIAESRSERDTQSEQDGSRHEPPYDRSDGPAR